MENLKEVPKEEVKKDKIEGITKDTIKDGAYSAEIIRDWDGKVDPFYLNKKDPNFEYRFLRDEMKNLSIKTGNLLNQKGGWKLCPKEHLMENLSMREDMLDANGHYRAGDTILAFMPKKLYKEKEAYKRKQAQEPVEAVERLLKKGDASMGLLHPTMKGIQPKDNLKGNWKE